MGIPPAPSPRVVSSAVRQDAAVGQWVDLKPQVAPGRGPSTPAFVLWSLQGSLVPAEETEPQKPVQGQDLLPLKGD